MTNQTYIIGGGQLCQALILGWRQCDDWNTFRQQLTVIEHNPTQQKALGYLAVTVVSEIPEAFAPSATIIIAIKPQNIPELKGSLKGKLLDQKLISVAAGLKIQTLMSVFDHRDIARAMPNLAAQINQSFTGLWAIEANESFARAEKLFAKLGQVVGVSKEVELDSLTAVTGSGLAYWLKTLASLVEAAQTLPMSKTLAEQATLATFIASAQMTDALQPIDPNTLIERIASSKGTTAAALTTVEKDLTLLWHKALLSAYNRCQEIDNSA